jgi:Protein of unknown function (DUF3164)
MTNEDVTIPAGYWQDANGNLVPVSKIKDIDKDRNKAVIGLCEQAKKASASLLGFKLTAAQAVDEFVAHSLDKYEVKHGGKRGNVTLVSYDGRYMVKRQIQDKIVFDERLQAAKILIDKFIVSASKGSSADIKLLVNKAFDVDSAGNINVGRVLELRSYEITHPDWLEAMGAIGDSIKVASTKAYLRFYERNDTSGEYLSINLDVAAL